MAALQNTPSTLIRYIQPDWTRKILRNVPEYRLSIANLPTPLYKLQSNTRKDETNLDKSILGRLDKLNITLLMKMDDMTAGVEMGGNKIRKLEFLLADALHNKFDDVVTIGGEQSVSINK